MENATDITINALPTVVANATSQTVCAGEQITLSGSGADSYTWNNNVTDGVAFAPTQSGYFTVVGVNNTTLCSNMDSVMVTVNDLPDTSVVQNGNQLAAVLAGATYQWVDCDDNFSPIANATDQTFVPSTTGNYALVVTQNACSDTSSCYNVMTVGIEDATAKEIVLLLYPNPSNGEFRMISNVESPMEVNVFNMMGQTIYTSSNVKNNSVIDLQGVENGLYSIRFHNDELNVLRQVIVAR
ncbi:MAG: T9SS type A sorting domain-containing protein [Flavobacteriales bacterium]|nr:T9SS type A sorting domain-containing protein [Flavobacteriales bacterium]